MVVIAGDERGKRGKVLEVQRDKNRVIVEGAKMIKKTLRKNTNANRPQGAIIEREGTIHVSNVMPVDPKTSRGSRVRFEVESKDGRIVSKRRMTVGGSVVEDVKPS